MSLFLVIAMRNNAAKYSLIFIDSPAAIPMEFSLFNDEDIRQQTIPPPSRHINTDALIEPWTNARTPLIKTLPLPKKEPSTREGGQRKKTMDERIEEMYRKYSKEGISVSRESARGTSRELYREMLREFEKAQGFKQLGSKRERSALETEAEQFSMELLNKKMNSCVCAYDYKEMRVTDSPPRAPPADLKCAGKFQRMMKIRDKIRKKNSIAVSKQKDKFLSEYHPNSPYSQREATLELATPADREKARMKIRIRNQSKSNIVIDNSNTTTQEFKIIGTFSNAFEYALNRGIANTTSNSMRGDRRKNKTLNHTFHVLRQ